MLTKMNFHIQPKTKMDIHFQLKNENESHLIILDFFFFIHSVTESTLQCTTNTSSSFAFLQVVLVDGIPLSFFLDDISTREQFAFLVYCYRVQAVFHNLCTVLYWHLCGLTNSPIVKFPLNWGWSAWNAEGSLKQWLPNGKLLLLSHKMPWCALLTAVKNYNKSLEKLQDFFFKTETKTKCSRPKPRLHDSRPRPRLSFLSSRCLESRDQDPGLEDYLTYSWTAHPFGTGINFPCHS